MTNWINHAAEAAQILENANNVELSQVKTLNEIRIMNQKRIITEAIDEQQKLFVK